MKQFKNGYAEGEWVKMIKDWDIWNDQFQKGKIYQILYNPSVSPNCTYINNQNINDGNGMIMGQDEPCRWTEIYFKPFNHKILKIL